MAVPRGRDSKAAGAKRGGPASAAVPPLPAKLPSQRTPADFKVKRIKAERELVRDPAYVPEFVNVPIRYADFPVRLDTEEYALLQKVKRTELYGDDDGAALRDIVFSWWEDNYMGK